MSDWPEYPDQYRQTEVSAILSAVRSGECVALIGLSGSGKSNVLGFMANRRSTPDHPLILVDNNRLFDLTPTSFFLLLRYALDPVEENVGHSNPMAALNDLRSSVARHLQVVKRITFLIDRFDVFYDQPSQPLYNALRALRDEFKYQLTYVTAARRPLQDDNELAELFYAHTIWLGPLSESDAKWNIRRYGDRVGAEWGSEVQKVLIETTMGYPSILRAACEALAGGGQLEQLAKHRAVQARVEEFKSDDPTQDELALSGVADHPLLTGVSRPVISAEKLTAKEQLLFDYFVNRPNTLCQKDELIIAVWSEDAVFEEGVRDSSLAQLVRRLRLKIEPDPASPRFIITLPGRGYLYKPDG